MAQKRPNSPSMANEKGRQDKAFQSYLQNAFDEAELDVAYILNYFASNSTTPKKTSPPSGIPKFDANLTLEAAKKTKKKNEDPNKQPSPPTPPRVPCLPFTNAELCICDTCGKELSEKSALIRHQQVHDEASKKFVCKVCGNKQRQRSNWKQHVLTHIGEDLPPEIYASLDEVTKALVDGDERFVPRILHEKRMEIARKRRMKFQNP